MIKSEDVKIGTKYMSAGKYGRECIVVDIYKTYNTAGELVKTRYVTEHNFLGQAIRDHDVCVVTIQRGHIEC